MIILQCNLVEKFYVANLITWQQKYTLRIYVLQNKIFARLSLFRINIHFTFTQKRVIEFNTTTDMRI